MINIKSSSRYIPLELSESLKKENVVSTFFYDKVTNSVKIELNHKMERTDIILSIDKKNWQKNGEMLTKLAKRKGINDKNLTELLEINLDNNWNKIIGIDSQDNIDSNNDYNNLNDDDNSTLSDQYDLSDQTKNEDYGKNNKNNQLVIRQEQEEQEKTENNNAIPLLSVLQAKRSSEGLIRVIGRIVGRSTNFRVVAKCEWKCQNFDCQNRGSSTFNPPRLHPLKNLDNTNGTNPSCFICKTFGSINVIQEYKNAKIIQLDDINTVEEKFDRLDVIMYDDASNHIMDGEIVEIEGDLRTQKRIGLANSTNGSKMVNVLHSDKTIIYKNKKEIKITTKDIETFYRWKKICQIAYKKELEAIKKYSNLKEEERPNWVKKIKPMTFEQRVTAMFAPNVYGHADKKMGILRSIVGGSKAENGAENGRRGRIHTLLIGDPGTTKTLLSH